MRSWTFLLTVTNIPDCLCTLPRNAGVRDGASIHSHTHARSHNYPTSSCRSHNMWTLNIVERVVGCFVGLWCLFVSRCEIVMVSGVYRELVYCLVCRDIQHSYIIFAYTCCCSIILIYILGTHILIHLHCNNVHKLVNIHLLTLPGSHASTYWSQRESALALG